MNFLQKLLYLPDYLNGFGMGDPVRNGEYRFLRNHIKNNMIVFDVGANIGEYTNYLLNHADNLTIHTFEPVKATFNELKIRLAAKNNAKIYFNNFGLSDNIEEMEILIYKNLGGSNSLYYNAEIVSKTNNPTKELIKLDTIDNYVLKNNIINIDLVKIDVEGYESKVLLGAKISISQKIIKAFQFEYGGFWKSTNLNLTDIFEYLSDNSYKIYRLTPWGRILISRIKKNLNNYKHSNYIALL